MHIIFFLSVSLLQSLVSSTDLDGLVQVHLVFRHGDRTPISPYPKDPYKNYNWPGGLGQLTNAGKRRHHELGAWLRSRYQGWLSEQYDNHQIVVRSTDTDRTLMSAMANLAGVYCQPLVLHCSSNTIQACFRLTTAKCGTAVCCGNQSRCTLFLSPRTISSPATPTVHALRYCRTTFSTGTG